MPNSRVFNLLTIHSKFEENKIDFFNAQPFKSLYKIIFKVTFSYIM